MERVVLIDGNGLLFRAYHALPATLRTSRGLPTNAAFGFAKMFRKILAGRRVAIGAVIFDAGGGTFRHRIDPSYKHHRDAMPSDLVKQLPWVERLVLAHNFPVLRIPDVEADDVIATLATQAIESGHEVVIVSGDKDFAQLVGPRVKVFDPTSDVWLDGGLVFRKWGVKPSQFVDYQSLVGDRADGVSGVAGIGAKQAAELLAQHETLDAWLASGVSAGQRDDALRSRALVTLRTDVTLPCSLHQLALKFPTPEQLNAVYRELEFFSLLSAEAAGTKGRAKVEYFVCDTPDTARAALAELTGTVGIHALIEYPTAHRGALVGFGLSPRPGRALYYPATPEILSILQPWLEDDGCAKVLHNAKAAYVALAKRGIRLRGVVGDTALASYLLAPTQHLPHRLEQVARAWLHRAVQPVRGVVGKAPNQKRFGELPPGRSGAYACHLADAVGELWPQLHRRLREALLATQLTEVDLPLAFVLADIELRGLAADTSRLATLGNDFAALRDATAAEVFESAGRTFSIGSHRQLGTVLFEELGLPILKRTKTGYSTAVDVLDQLAPKHPIIGRVRRWRTLDKLVNTYTDVLQAAVDPTDGRIHPTFQTTVSASGRLITTEPDLQRTPVRTAEFRQVRQALIAAPGHKLISADWSQIELRVLAHISQDPVLLQAFQSGDDVHTRTAAEVLGLDVSEVTKEQRELGKTVNFATIYGQGPTALSRQLEISTAEAKRYIDAFFGCYAGVATWRDRVTAQAHSRGYVLTLAGRRRYIDELSTKNWRDRAYGERIAVNTPIQGSAADLCKLALLRVHEALKGMRSGMVLQIHDELLIEAPNDEVDAVIPLVRDIMEQVWPDLNVPLAVDVAVGDSWDM
jgi:DNA polymerase I